MSALRIEGTPRTGTITVERGPQGVVVVRQSEERGIGNTLHILPSKLPEFIRCVRAVSKEIQHQQERHNQAGRR